MRRKLVLLIAALLMTITASAQFEEGKVYANASLSGLNLSYNGNDKFNFGVEGKVGYLFMDNWMLLGEGSFVHSGNDDVPDYATIGAQCRYYIVQNGLYLGAGCKLLHANHNYNDIVPGIELGYSFFISHTVTIEPSIYYDQSFKNHSDYSTIGLKVGFGIYL